MPAGHADTVPPAMPLIGARNHPRKRLTCEYAMMPAMDVAPMASTAIPFVQSYESFMLAGIAGIGADGRRKSVYVHAKLMLVDDAWATVGSCNLHRFSLFGNGEMNVAFSEPDTVRAFRCELLREHLGQDTCGMDDRDALCLFRKIAGENRRKLEAGDPQWQGLAFELDLATYVG